MFFGRMRSGERFNNAVTFSADERLLPGESHLSIPPDHSRLSYSETASGRFRSSLNRLVPNMRQSPQKAVSQAVKAT